MNPVDPSPIPRRDQVIALFSQNLPEWRRRYGFQEMWGSLARNETRAGSDVDLCISLDYTNPFSLVCFQQEAELQLDLHAGVVPRLPSMNPAFKEEIDKAVIFI